MFVFGKRLFDRKLVSTFVLILTQTYPNQNFYSKTNFNLCSNANPNPYESNEKCADKFSYFFYSFWLKIFGEIVNLFFFHKKQ